MALESQNWKREYLKSRAEVKALKAEIKELRASANADGDLSEIKSELALLRANINSLTELVKKAVPVVDKVTMEDDPVFEKVREVLAKHLNIDKDDIETKSDVNTDDDAFKAAIQELAEYAGTEIPFDDYKNFAAVSDLVVYLNNGKPAKRDDKQATAKDEDNAVNFATVTTTIQNKTGVHARAAFRFVKAASNFKSKITISSKGATVDAKNMLMIMSVGLAYGAEVTVNADGPDARQAIAALKKLIDDKFGEE